MGRYPLMFAVACLASMIQVSFLPAFFPELAVPDIGLVIVVLWTVRYGFNEKWARIVGLGLVFDLLTYSPPGVHVLTYVLSAFAISFLTRRILSQELLWKYILIFVFVASATAMSDLLLSLITNLRGYISENAYLPDVAFSVDRLMMKASLNVILLALIYWPVMQVEKMVENIKNARAFGRSVKF